MAPGSNITFTASPRAPITQSGDTEITETETRAATAAYLIMPDKTKESGFRAFVLHLLNIKYYDLLKTIAHKNESRATSQKGFKQALIWLRSQERALREDPTAVNTFTEGVEEARRQYEADTPAAYLVSIFYYWLEDLRKWDTGWLNVSADDTKRYRQAFETAFGLEIPEIYHQLPGCMTIGSPPEGLHFNNKQLIITGNKVFPEQEFKSFISTEGADKEMRFDGLRPLWWDSDNPITKDPIEAAKQYADENWNPQIYPDLECSIKFTNTHTLDAHIKAKRNKYRAEAGLTLKKLPAGYKSHRSPAHSGSMGGWRQSICDTYKLADYGLGREMMQMVVPGDDDDEPDAEIVYDRNVTKEIPSVFKLAKEHKVTALAFEIKLCQSSSPIYESDPGRLSSYIAVGPDGDVTLKGEVEEISDDESRDGSQYGDMPWISTRQGFSGGVPQTSASQGVSSMPRQQAKPATTSSVGWGYTR